MCVAEALFGKNPIFIGMYMAVGLVVCYAFGTVWFMNVYMRTKGAVGIGAVLGWCVIPFIIPDVVKIALAMVVSRRVSAYIGK